ncbi:MAG: tyrosinase family protein [Calothrix sp. MO_167.B12]|nr:tyrosinase family protein [Calothrix sp. MO_167.B12]
MDNDTKGLFVRKEISQLSAEELQKLRTAYALLQQEVGEGGYQQIAGLHGLPLPSYCPHNDPSFLPWHRAYLVRFEQALQRHVPDVTLPYWDWISQESQTKGLPDAVVESTYVNSEGVEVPNPLYSAQLPIGGQTTRRRIPISSRRLSELENPVAVAMQETNFIGFSERLENPHNFVHVWVGGSMSSVPYAAFDPIFWMHHAYVDRQWYIWQQNNPEVPVPDDIAEEIYDELDMSANDILDINNLPYQYDESPEPAVGSRRVITPFGLAKFRAVESMQPRVELIIHNLSMTSESFELRIFLNDPQANHTSPIYGNPHFTGSVFLFGMGEIMHSMEMDHGMDHGMHHPGGKVTFDRAVDITNALNLSASKDGNFDIKMLILDVDGQPVENPPFEMPSVSLKRHP